MVSNGFTPVPIAIGTATRRELWASQGVGQDREKVRFGAKGSIRIVRGHVNPNQRENLGPKKQ